MGAKRGLALVGVILLGSAGAAAWLWSRDGVEPLTKEGFDRGRLPAGWTITREGDFSERRVDVVDLGGEEDLRLRIRAGTIGTRDDTLKFLGVRHERRIDLSSGTIGVDLDWNEQQNGSYLSAYLVLSPHETSRNPLQTDDWLQVGYVGVPPGRNARMVVALQSGGDKRTLFADGWPEDNREGRPIGRQRLAVRVRDGALEILENGRSIQTPPIVLPFQSCYLYLQLSSHSNYRPREIYFDDIAVSSDGDS